MKCFQFPPPSQYTIMECEKNGKFSDYF